MSLLGKLKNKITRLFISDKSRQGKPVYQVIAERLPVGEVRKCELDNTCTLRIKGWLLPRSRYDTIEIIIDGVFRGTATLDIINKAALRKFPSLNEEKSGFSFSAFGYYRNAQIIVRALKDGEETARFECGVTCPSIEEDREKLEKQILQQLAQEVNTEEKIKLYNILCDHELLTPQLFQDYCHTIERLNDYEELFYLGIYGLYKITIFYPEILYPEYYQEHRRFCQKLMHQLYPYPLSTQKPIRDRIAFTVPNLSDQNSATAIVRLNIARVMYERGYCVRLFISDMGWTSDELKSNTIIPHNKVNSKRNMEYHNKLFPTDSVFYNYGETLKERIANFVKAVDTFCPEVILDASGEIAAFLSLLSEKYKSVQVTNGGYTTSAEINKYISFSKEHCIEVNSTFHSVSPDQVVGCPLLVSYDLSEVIPLIRSDHNLPEDEFIFTTVGARLNVELKKDFCDAAARVLREHNRYRWILVTRKLNPVVMSEYADLIASGQMILWGYENNLAGFFHMVDAYVDPDRMGGGGSVELAMMLGIPVLMTDEWRDITPVMGIENCVRGGYDALFDELVRLAEDKDYRTERGQKMKELINREEISMEHYVDVLERTITELRGRV